MGRGRCAAGLGALAVLCAAAAAAATAPQEEPAHLFSEVFFCQRDPPFSGLAQTLDDDELFWFDFPGSTWHPRLPSFQPEVQNRTSIDKIGKQRDFCNEVLTLLTNFSDTYIGMPEAKGIPQVEIFTLQPLQLGKPNTLVCSVTNVFPPSATISWQHQDKPVDLGVTTTQIYPIQTLDFQIFSYLEVTPQERDVYSCTVKTPRSKFSSMAFWVPKDPIASQLLEDVLCGLGCGVGILFTVMGLALIALALRFRRAAGSP
ncbi:class II histocompatibility antigen, M alpha chain [Varanus komodoensis]|uniref:class II histocompatibility antigen, M alpha chain n=1 Tax=Varanus komodoensis TaxID=61221 RepID=UPI001CF7DE98|nr:class II histocompatibility antigen, M alpha chain [Varanus komodoensis]